eukprot:TRINITY_DN2745_c0_g1_i1.p1 TRINITY_DN2745_c0_g1~~TRINITY_DN2745_c0_g1_i1.p1  ORF type:complete len:248 (+),score=53.65 TRINITY_DN2745_c0_g1_i1:89-745(+)
MSNSVSLAPETKAAAAAVASTPAVQAAAMRAAQDPEVQKFGRSVVANTAQEAVKVGAARASAGFLEVRQYIQESHLSVRIIAFCTALVLLVTSILGVFNVFSALFKPYQYLVAFYNVLFACIIIVADGKPEWFVNFWDLQNMLFRQAAFLASQLGRAMFYFYVGLINLCMLPDTWLWKMIYLGIGATLCFNGVLMMIDYCGLCGKRHVPMQEEVMAEA